MEVIKVEHLTKDFKQGRGVFDVSFSLEKGEVLGFLGPNGAGKATTIRHIVGFLRPQSGATSVMSMNSWLQSSDIQNYIGYLPGEINFPTDMTGEAYIKTVLKLRKKHDRTKADALLERFSLDPSGKIQRMSKGTKQKLGIVTAFMHDPQILILDEPTSGLDPLMQNRFVELVREEKAKGKTILLSSHLFEEVEMTCDRILIIKEGRIVANVDGEELSSKREKKYALEFLREDEKIKFMQSGFSSEEVHNTVEVVVSGQQLNDFVAEISQYQLLSLSQVQHSLEDYFMAFYGGDKNE